MKKKVQESSEKWPSRLLRNLDAAELTRLLALLATLGALIVGKFSFDRFFDEQALGSPFLELRLWSTVFAGLAVLVWGSLAGHRKERNRRARLVLALTGVIGFHLFLLIHLSLFGTGSVADTALDLIYIVAHVLTVAATLRHPKDLLLVAWALELAGGVLFLLAAVGVGNPELYGYGWAPFGTPTSFYRIEFLSFCAALYAAFSARVEATRVFHFLLAALMLYATFASLSKAALLASAVVFFYWMVILFVFGRYRRGTELFLLGAVVLAVFLFTPAADNMGARLSSGVGLEAQSILKSTSISPNWTSADVGNFLRSKQFEEELQMRKLIILADRTQRITLFTNAWNMFRQAPFLGMGFGGYSVKTRNTTATGFEVHSYPHNIILEVLAATGLIGGILFLLSGTSFIILVHQAVRTEPKLLFFTGYLIFLTISALFTGNFFDFRGFWIVGVMLICTAWPVLQKKT